VGRLSLQVDQHHYQVGVLPSFISRLPVSGSNHLVDIDIVEVKEDDWNILKSWDEKVGQHLQETNRADANWKWHSRIAPIVFYGGFRRRPRIFQMTIGRDKVPAAMIAILEEERWVENSSENAVFLWFLSTAPDAYWQTVVNDLPGMPKLVGRAALDVALTIALDGLTAGKLWLHADPKGGHGLRAWYGTDCGMTCLGKRAFPTLPGFSPSIRSNDGRYFCFTEETAKWAHWQMDEWRTQREKAIDANT
jgi:hypothetical protein